MLKRLVGVIPASVLKRAAIAAISKDLISLFTKATIQ